MAAIQWTQTGPRREARRSSRPNAAGPRVGAAGACLPGLRTIPADLGSDELQRGWDVAGLGLEHGPLMPSVIW